MDIVRTPDERFATLPDFPYAPHYREPETPAPTCGSSPAATSFAPGSSPSSLRP